MRPVPKIICVACTDGIWDRFDFLGARGFRGSTSARSAHREVACVAAVAVRATSAIPLLVRGALQS